MPLLAHGFLGGHALEHAAAFGTLWWAVAVPLAVLATAGMALVLAAPAGTTGLLTRFGAGGARLTGLPAWCAATLLLQVAGLLIAVLGFIWDVSWHVDVGRDEFLFSPPHMFLLLGLGMIGVAGVVGITLATAEQATAGWRIGRWQVPYGAGAMAVAGAAALLGFGVDELWHQAYGLDVTMWSPPHLTMISAAVFSGLATWITYAEAGPNAANRQTRWVLGGLAPGILLIALSAWQLEYDLGIAQWQTLAQPVLIAIAGAFALTAARAALGRGGALITVAHFVVIRALLSLVSATVWDVTPPRFPLYLGAAVAVELAFAVTARRPGMVTFLMAGAGVGTLGLAAEWAGTHLWMPHAWQPGLFPRILLATAAAVAAAVLGGAFGRVVSHRPSGLRGGIGLGAFAVLLLAIAIPLPRHVPTATATVTTAPAGEGLTMVTVALDRPDLVAGADRWEVMAWQGGGFVVQPLEPVGAGRWQTAGAVPFGGNWKTLLRLANGSLLGGMALSMPADAEIGAPAVPLQSFRSEPLVADQELFLREAHDGPRWPGLVAYTFVGLSLAAILGSLAAGAVGLERRRRIRGWGRRHGSLDGKRVLLTGAAGGIGSAARTALEAQGARVVGLDLVTDRPDTLVVDITDRDALTAAVQTAVERLGGLDVIIANAGIGIGADSQSAPDAEARRLLEINLLGAWETITAALPYLDDGGRIVGVTSGLAVATIPYAGAYIASKRGLSGYLDVLRIELEGRHSVSEVRPGFIDTAIHRQSASTNASLEGLVRREPVSGAAAAIVTACETGRRRIASSPRTAAELFVAHHFPGLAERWITRQLRRIEAARGRPSFAPPPYSDTRQ
jgi:NAD(P)-dependent dehydrogenase (short-subunit alcohol dehydrogenase family)